MKAAYSIAIVGCWMVLMNAASSAAAAPAEPTVELGKTADGVEYGTWSTKAARPAPLLIILAGTIEDTLSSPYFRQCGNQLAEQGYLCASIDLPCHGKQVRDSERSGLSGWSQRAARGDNFVAECNQRLASVVDHLIEAGAVDPSRMAVCGTSRGGYLAIHFAAHDHRVQCAAAFGPVTDLAAVSEFRAVAEAPLVRQLSLASHAEKLVGRPVWISIGHADERVGTQHAVALGELMEKLARERQIEHRMQVHVVPGTPGHTTPKGAPQQAADWIAEQMGD